MIAKNEHKIEMLVSSKFRDVVTEPRRELIRAGFIEGFKRRDFNEGLKHGVAAIAAQTVSIHSEGRLPQTTTAAALLGFASASSNGAAPLVVRNQITGGPNLYGFLLGVIGASAVGAARVLPWLKAKLGPDGVVAAGTVGTALTMLHRPQTPR